MCEIIIGEKKRKVKEQEKLLKKRAVYWDCLRFLDVVEDERDSFSNISEHEVTGVIDEITGGIDEITGSIDEVIGGIDEVIGVVDEKAKVVEECVSTKQTSDQSTLPNNSEHTPTEHTQMSSGQKTCSDDFQLPKSNKTKENSSLNKYLKEKKEDRDHFKRCLEELITPEPEEDATNMFFKTIAATVKNFCRTSELRQKPKFFKLLQKWNF